MDTPQIQSKKDKLKTIDWLIEQFPAAFFKDVSNIKPLKIGVLDDIIDFYERLDSPAVSKKAIREALSYYSASPAYLKCQKANTARVDLFGIEVDVVTEDQAKYAALRHSQRYSNLRATNK